MDRLTEDNRLSGAPGIAEMIAAQGALGALTARIDAGSPLGPVNGWSPALVSTVRLMLSSQAEIVLFWGPELCALYNEAYAPTIGDKHPRVLGRPAREGWTELWDDLEPLLRSVIDRGQSVHAKDRPFYIERDGGQGEQVFFDINYSPVFEADGSVGGALCIVSETTKRVLAEKEMRADRARLWALARDPFLVADRDGTWLAASPAWTDILGWSEAELIGRTSEWMEHPDDLEKTKGEIAGLARGTPTVRFENRFRAKDGSYRNFSWTAVPENDLIYCVARDVTEQRAHARALAEAEEALRQAQKMETLGQLTGGVAHDFNNLLQIVTGNLELLQRGLNEDQARLRRAADNAMAGAERAALLTQRLLAFARRQPLAPERIDPNRLVSGMSDMLNRTLGETIEVETIQSARIWPIEIDVNQMENALLNLAVNARDAMPDGGKLTIEVANTHIDEDYAAQEAEVSPGQYVLISVSDTGEGMDEEVLSHAIEPFFTTKEVGRGTGLGLSMVYGFIKQSGGHIRVYSESGHGTTVKIYLPRFYGPLPDNDTGVAERTAPVCGGDETVLVCEDDDKVRAYTVDVLKELGYRVIEANDGAAALRALDAASQSIDLLFTDVILPGGMTGADIAQQARAQQPGLKVLFATGYARNAIIHHGRLDPGVELLTKPFTYAELATKVRDMLDRDEARQVG
ncbi:hybrid sensor histidine kinase/response regulator [Sphingobium sp. TA15]|uniref:histidine kinase n=1 Tax=Sphingobium indicum (strain DSM 16413 / CCM 7287 / MTCC 6362 / UT26 / NBRC 101211 / UT26S) TaxID=452662 RepID=D4YYK3_SPHIU|nr:ATP-binding protein [Sphingobium indicum]BAI95435.1 signal transduction histidine kinase [Sphingobium indicum UT26S]BDD68215.1 hybrid sensor histidine kinase/response regulator [Sphingobium sp. TA15]